MHFRRDILNAIQLGLSDGKDSDEDYKAIHKKKQEATDSRGEEAKYMRNMLGIEGDDKRNQKNSV
jgi:hypothetical protein